MIFGARFFSALLALLCLLAPVAQAQSAWGVAELMQELAQTSSATASFTERETSPLLTAPLISTGILTYIAPDYLRKTTNLPASEVFTLDHGEVTLTSAAAGGTQIFALNQDPRIAGLVTGIRATLAGDLPALTAVYTVTLSGDPAGWELRLAPRDPALAHIVRVIFIAGVQGRITTIDTQTGDGGRTLMTVRMDDAP
jgi:hypothetical protein